MDTLDHFVANSSTALKNAAARQTGINEENPFENIKELLEHGSGKDGEFDLPKQRWHLQGNALRVLYTMSQNPEYKPRLVREGLFELMIPTIAGTDDRILALRKERFALENGEGLDAKIKLFRHDEAARMQAQEISDIRHMEGDVDTYQVFAGFIMKNLAAMKELRSEMATPENFQALFKLLEEHKDVRLAVLMALTSFADSPLNADLMDAGLIQALNLVVFDDDYLVRRNTEIGEFHDDVALAAAALYAQMATPETMAHMEEVGAVKALNFIMKKAEDSTGYNTKIMIAVMKAQGRILPPLPKPKPMKQLEVAQGLALDKRNNTLEHVMEWDWPRSLV
jgi:hypothetical protein